jgi:hypothetical protein
LGLVLAPDACLAAWITRESGGRMSSGSGLPRPTPRDRSEPLEAGAVAPAVTVSAQVTQALFAEAALNAAGLLDGSRRPTGSAVVWADNDRELFVHVAAVRVRLAPGVVAVTIPVRCEETGAADIHVSFAVGAEDRPTGLLAATEERPRGPRLVVDLWGESLVAFAWQILLNVAARVAFSAGTDVDGAGLVPAALAAGPDGLAVLPQARHSFDRVPRP